MSATSDGLPRELAHRTSDGLDVFLLWQRERGRDRLAVVVTDSRTGGSFELEVRRGERPLDVFHHPFAFAAAHGIVPQFAALGGAIASGGGIR